MPCFIVSLFVVVDVDGRCHLSSYRKEKQEKVVHSFQTMLRDCRETRGTLLLACRLFEDQPARPASTTSFFEKTGCTKKMWILLGVKFGGFWILTKMVFEESIQLVLPNCIVQKKLYCV